MRRKKLQGAVRYVAIAAVLSAWGCSGSTDKGRLVNLEKKLEQQQVSVTRLTQTVENLETQARYKDEQRVSLSGTERGQLPIVRQVGIRFAFNRYDLSPAARATLDDIAGDLSDDPSALIEILGYTDAVGSREYNYTLGGFRAETVARYLHKKFGVPLYRMREISYGEDDPAVKDGETRNAANRRVEVRVRSHRLASSKELP